MKSEGSCFPQVLISKLREIGMLMLMPRMLALIAVQRHTAASRSTSPWSIEQQGVSGGFPTTVPTAPLSNLAHTPSFRASLGQLFPVGFGLGFGIGFGWTQVLHPFARANNRRLMKKKRAADELLASISLTLIHSQVICSFWEECAWEFIEWLRMDSAWES